MAHAALLACETAEDILRDFFELRMAYYGKRRLALIQASILDPSSPIQGTSVPCV